MYKELDKDENFSDTYPTWIIAYCLDTNSFYVTNERYFYWEYEKEFQSENDGIAYFREHLKEFYKIRNEILSTSGGWDKNDPLHFWNTKENFKVPLSV